MIVAAVEADPRVSLRRHLAKHPTVSVHVGERSIELQSRHGLFSARSLDRGSEMLLNELSVLSPPRRLLDIGCGYGALGLSLAVRWPDADVDLVDTDIRAIEAASENIERLTLNNANAKLSDGIRELSQPQGAHDLVVSNLPAQAGNDALDQLLLDAYDALAPQGALAVVAVNGLRKYLHRRLSVIFGQGHVAKVRQGPRHTVLEAAKPAR